MKKNFLLRFEREKKCVYFSYIKNQFSFPSFFLPSFSTSCNKPSLTVALFRLNKKFIVRILKEKYFLHAKLMLNHCFLGWKSVRKFVEKHQDEKRENFPEHREFFSSLLSYLSAYYEQWSLRSSSYEMKENIRKVNYKTMKQQGKNHSWLCLYKVFNVLNKLITERFEFRNCIYVKSCYMCKIVLTIPRICHT